MSFMKKQLFRNALNFKIASGLLFLFIASFSAYSAVSDKWFEPPARMPEKDRYS